MNEIEREREIGEEIGEEIVREGKEIFSIFSIFCIIFAEYSTSCINKNSD